MQDKESDGSSKTLMEIVARAIDENPHNDVREWARSALTAIKEAGFEVVSRDFLERLSKGSTASAIEARQILAMITAGEE